MTQEYEALAARVEAAGPDRDVNRDILVAIGWRVIDGEVIHPDGSVALGVPDYTASLDAATSVFPPDTMYRSGHDGAGPDPSLFYCEAITAAPECRRVRAVAVSEACARLAAALRAHLIKDQADGE